MVKIYPKKEVMPKAFKKCVKSGGKVRTIKPKANKYIHVCYKGGKSYSGEVKTTSKRRKKK